MLDWLYENRTWLFEGIGVVLLVAAATGLWRLVQRKGARGESPRAAAGTPPRTGVGVELTDVKAKNADIGDIRAPDAGVVIHGGEFSEDLTIHAVEVGQARSGQPAAAPPVIGSQMTNVHARDITVETHLHTPDDPSLPDPADLRRAYLERLYQQANVLSLAGIDPKAAADAEAGLELAAVYTALLTQTPEDDELQKLSRGGDRDPRDPAARERRRSAVAQLDRAPRLVLLGDPGSGKSTFVNFATLCLAGELLGDKPANLARFTAPLPEAEESRRAEEKPAPQPWGHGPLLPVRIILRDFAARGLPAAATAPGAESVLRFVGEELAACGLGAYTPFLRKQLLEQGGLVLFDGLDEVPEADRRRAQLKQVVDDFARTFRRCRILVTSRTYAYQQQEWRLPGFTETVLEPFTRPQIAAFVDNWYAHVAVIRHGNSGDAQGRAELLKRAIFASDRLYALAERPLLLTLMASLHAWRGGTLPEKRVDLYADAVSLLMDRWESERVVRNKQGEAELIQPSLVEALRVGREGILLQLNRLAYEAHSRQPALTGTADIAESDLVGALLSINQNPDTRPRLLMDYLSNRAGLLTPRGVQVYTFPHRTFQEYLAACHLTEDNFPDLVATLAREDPNRWREVVLLAGAKAAGGPTTGGSAYALWALVEALYDCPPDAATLALPDAWGALLAGQALAETADLRQVSERNRLKLAKVRHGLQLVLTGAQLPAVERGLAGRSLAKLGDPRTEVLDPLATTFCYVPAGSFVMGEGKEQFEYTVAYPYWMARYPVTNAQYGVFVAEGGYAQPAYWPEARKDGFWKNNLFRDRSAPRAYGDPFDLPNHPVVGVSWYEALAFTRWLETFAGSAGILPAGLHVNLPNEPEWEKAARGGLELPAQPHVRPFLSLAGPTPARAPNLWSRRTYPWGEQPDPERANYGATKIGSTNAVGAFAGGASPYGVEELSGNVWEWTRSLWDSEASKEFGFPYRTDDGREDLRAGEAALRVVRGGAFFFNEDLMRCAARSRYSPYYELRYYGFRVVLSPFSTSGL